MRFGSWGNGESEVRLMVICVTIDVGEMEVRFVCWKLCGDQRCEELCACDVVAGEEVLLVVDCGGCWSMKLDKKTRDMRIEFIYIYVFIQQ